MNSINSIYFSSAALFFVLSLSQPPSKPQTSPCDPSAIPPFIPAIPPTSAFLFPHLSHPPFSSFHNFSSFRPLPLRSESTIVCKQYYGTFSVWQAVFLSLSLSSLLSQHSETNHSVYDSIFNANVSWTTALLFTAREPSLAIWPNA